ncbi:MAG: helix-turn-helix transcriptional regulator [Nitrospiraceae bacterium]
MFDDFSKQDVQTILEVLHHALQADTGDDVSQILQLLRRVISCEKIIGGVARVDANGTFEEFTSVINVSYSNDWLYRYGKNGYAAVDPVLTSLLSTFKTQVWTQTYEGATSGKQKEFIEEARSFGLLNGITTGLLEARRGYASFFSFAGGESADKLRYQGVLEYVTPLLHRAMLNNVGTPLHNRVKGLSSREINVLLWMKEGKTNWEISRILGMTERTVRFHIERIFGKLEVTSRTQAIALVVEERLLANP